MRHSYAWVCAVILAGTACAQDAAPKIVCDAPLHDFGTITGTEDVNHVFVVRNAGNADLLISRVHATCGCTTAIAGTNSVAPGGTVDISATFSVRGRSGTQHKTIYIDSNDPQNPQYHLDIQGTIHQDVDVRPQQAVLQISASAPEARTEVHVSFNTPEPHTITGLETSNPGFFTATLVENTAGKAYTVIIATETNRDLKANYTSGNVTVLTDFPARARIDIPVTLHEIRNVVVAPASVTVSSQTPAGSSFTQQILVRSRTPEPMAVLAITTPNGDIIASTNKLSENMYRVEVVISNATAALNGQIIGIRVQRQGAAEESYEVPIRVLN